MGFRDWGNPPIYSTTAESGTDPSTTTVIAQIQGLGDHLYETRWTIGASTGALWKLELASTTTLSTTVVRQRTLVFTGSNQSAEFVTTFKAESGDLCRIIAQSSFTGTYAGSIQTEILT